MYVSATAFRQALEERLRRLSLESNTSLSRLRKLVAFDRLLARMVAGGPGLWILKGGYALESGDRRSGPLDGGLVFRR